MGRPLRLLSSPSRLDKKTQMKEQNRVMDPHGPRRNALWHLDGNGPSMLWQSLTRPQLSFKPAGTIRLAPHLSLHKQARSAKRIFPASKGVRLLERHAHQTSSHTFSHKRTSTPGQL